MTPEEFQHILEKIECSSEEIQRRLAEELRKRSHAKMLFDRSRLLNEYRKRWYADVKDRPAARAIEHDLSRIEASGLQHRASPPITDAKRAAAFELWRAGPPLKAESLRKLFLPLGRTQGGDNPTKR